jgi:hypothetical protein
MDNNNAKKSYNIAITTRQARVCINAMERELERLEQVYANTSDSELKELVAQKQELVKVVLDSLSTRLDNKEAA